MSIENKDQLLKASDIPMIPMGNEEIALWVECNRNLSEFYKRLATWTAFEFAFKSRLTFFDDGYDKESSAALYKLENTANLSIIQGVDPLTINKAIMNGLRIGTKSADVISKIHDSDKLEKKSEQKVVVVPVSSGMPIKLPESLKFEFKPSPIYYREPYDPGE